jgi:hypothetical protein
MMAQPVPVIALEYEHPQVAAAARPSRKARVTVMAAWLVCALSWLLIVGVDVHSVLITGPVIAVLGLMIAIRGIIERRPRFTVLGAAHVGICLLFVVLVNLFRWSPGDAKTHFAVMGAIHVVASGVASYWILSPSRWRQVARI